ncbi:MAG: hypothetical protein NTY48_01215 [Candidatus Diapherotrites archaeon]|nr:hypothetical protein [Candidatus Diapherotrites archaeon]
MAGSFSLSDEQKKAFEAILAGSAAGFSSSKAKGAVDAFNSLLGSDRVLTELKTKFSLSFSGSALVFCEPENSKEVLVALAKFCVQSEGVPVFVILGSNYKYVQKLLVGSAFLGEYFIVDAVSKSISSVTDTDKLFFVDSLRNLTQLEISVMTVANKGKKVVFIFDSIWALSLYHNEDVVTKFVYSMTGLLKKKGVSSFFISSNKAFGIKFTQFFDETFELRKFF